MSISLSIVCNTNTEFSEEKENKLESNNIPYIKSNGVIWFISKDDINISTDDISGNEFIVDMLSDISNFHLGGEFTNFDESTRKTLVEVFGKVQLDINLTDGYSGESDWLDFRLNDDLSLEYLFESDDD